MDITGHAEILAQVAALREMFASVQATMNLLLRIAAWSGPALVTLIAYLVIHNFRRSKTTAILGARLAAVETEQVKFAEADNALLSRISTVHDIAGAAIQRPEFERTNHGLEEALDRQMSVQAKQSEVLQDMGLGLADMRGELKGSFKALNSVLDKLKIEVALRNGVKQ